MQHGAGIISAGVVLDLSGVSKPRQLHEPVDDPNAAVLDLSGVSEPRQLPSPSDSLPGMIPGTARHIIRLEAANIIPAPEGPLWIHGVDAKESFG